MTYRTNPKNGDKVSLLGFGMMRLPVIEKDAPKGASGREAKSAPIDQEMVNKLVDKAIEYGVNYFDTAPVYCQGRSEHATGIALSRYKRDSYYLATKMSNFSPSTWPREESIKMFPQALLRQRHPRLPAAKARGGGHPQPRILLPRRCQGVRLPLVAPRRVQVGFRAD